jgi:hypothetical protein
MTLPSETERRDAVRTYSVSALFFRCVQPKNLEVIAMGEFTKMIVMHENEFYTRLLDFVYGALTDEERADKDILQGQLETWFEMLEWSEGVDGILVWHGKYGTMPEKLVWLDDANLFAEYALRILKDAEVTNYAQTTNNTAHR